MPGPTTLSQSVSGFDPRSIPGCVLWLDAADSNTFTFSSGTNISQWRDKSVSALTGTATNSPTQTAASINALPAVVFSGGTQYIDYGNNLNLGTNNVYIFTVVKFDSTANGAIVGKSAANGNLAGRWSLLRNNAEAGTEFIFDTGTATTNTGYADTSTTPQLISTYWDRSNTFIFQNGTQRATNVLANTTNYSTSYPLWVGAYQSATGGTPPTAGLYFIGKIGEIIIYQSATALTTTQRQAVEGYLAWKWGLEVSASFLPSSIPTPLMWFDAADSSTLTLSGTSVTQWRDKISNFTVTPSNAGYPPTRSGNGIYFNNVSPNISGTSIVLYSGTTWTLPTQTNSVFTVCAPDRLAGANEYRAIFNLQTPGSVAPNTFIMTQVASPNKEGNYYELDFNGTNWNLDYVGSPFATTLGQPRIDTIIGVPGATKLYTNNIENSYMASNFQGRTLQTNVPIQNTIIACGAGNRVFSGTIYEILVYSGAVTEQQRQTIQGYLASKWNVANIATSVLPTIHPFVQLRPTLRSFAPIDIPNCILWLDGGDGSTISRSGLNVTGWTDKSGLGNSVNGISATAPTYSLASNGIIFSSGSSTKLQGDFLNQSYNSNASVFVVTTLTSNALASSAPRLLELGFYQASPSSNTTLIGQLNCAGYANTASPILFTYVGTGTDPTNRGINIMTYFDITYGTRVIYTNISTYNTGTTSFSNLTYSNGNFPTYGGRSTTKSTDGAYGSNYNRYVLGGYYNANAAPGDSYDGVINEVIVFSRAVTTIERQTIEGYLGWKWNLSQSQPNTAPYYRIPPSIALPFSPLAISGCSSWVDALDTSRMVFYPGTSRIQNYIDKTSNFSYSNFQGTSTYAPLFQSNGFYCVNGTQTTNGTDGQEQQLRFSSIPNLNISRLTLVLLCKPDFLKATNLYANPATLGSGVPLLSALTPVQNTQPGGFPTEWFVDFNSGPSGSYFTLNNTSVTTTPSILVMTSGTTGGSLFTNGTLSGSVSWTNYTSPNTVTYELQLPCASTRGWTGYMYEAFVYNKVLSTTERQQIEGYLAAKWNIQSVLPSTHPFKKFSPGM